MTGLKSVTIFLGAAALLPSAAFAQGERPGAVIQEGMIKNLRFSADGRILKSVGYGGSAIRLYARSGRILSHTTPPDGYKDKVGVTAISDRGMAAGTVEDSQALLLWDVPRWGDT